MRVSSMALVILLLFFTLGTAVLATSLYRVQVDDVARFRKSFEQQATRRISIPGHRGRITDRHGMVLADSRPSHDIVCHPESFRRSGGLSNTVDAIEADIVRLAAVLRLPFGISAAQLSISLLILLLSFCIAAVLAARTYRRHLVR